MKNWFLIFTAILLSLALIPFVAAATIKGKPVPTLRVMKDGEITELNAEDYALLVLLGEGEICESEESKKALAVSARSIALYFSLYGCKHEEFDACDDGNCCLELGSIESADEETLDSAYKAVEETRGIALTIDGLPALSLFTLCSGSGTRQSEDFNYLSPTSEGELCDKHKHSNTFEKSGVFENVTSENTFIVYDESEKCEFLVINGKIIEGEDFIKENDLKSLQFSLFFDKEKIRIETNGIGHGYGLNLCGAEKKAKDGKDFEEILGIYFPRLNLNKIY